MEVEKKAGFKIATYGNGKDPYQHQRSASCIIPGVDCLRHVATWIWIPCGLWGTGEVAANLEEYSENFVASPVDVVAFRGWSWFGELYFISTPAYKGSGVDAAV